jgi:hypothetical protein
MAAGDITIRGPYNVGDSSAIDIGLTGQVVVADKIVSWTAGSQVWFAIVKAA